MQFLTAPNHPAGSPLTYFAPIAIRPTTPLVVPLPHAPRYGAHTREVLAEAGIDATPLFTRGVASEGWSTAYLPGVQVKVPGEVKVEVKAEVAAEMETCPVCLEDLIGRRVELGCSHSLCSGCATKCGDAGHRRCPICRVPHLLHPSRLAQRSTAWRQRYAAWRDGQSAGAHGEISSIRTPSALEELSGGGAAGCVGHSLRCGDVHHAAEPPTRPPPLPKVKTAPMSLNLLTGFQRA